MNREEKIRKITDELEQNKLIAEFLIDVIYSILFG